MAKGKGGGGSSKGKGDKNPERRNGKAWKKDRAIDPKPKTHERKLKDHAIRVERDNRRLQNQQRRAEEAKLASEKNAARNAEIETQKADRKALAAAIVLTWQEP